MALSSYTGKFQLSTDGGNQAITGIGFQPAVVIFLQTRKTGDGVVEDAYFSIGVGISSSERWVVCGSTEDGQATTDTRVDEATLCIQISNAGSSGKDAAADFVSMDEDGFTINVTNAPAAAYSIGFLALGGSDLTNVAAGNFAGSDSTGNQAVTGVGFQPDAVLFATVGLGTPPLGENQLQCSIGFATSSSARGAIAVSDENGQATSDTGRHQRTDECILELDENGAIVGEADFVSFDADGFTVNWSDATANTVLYLCLKGGQYHVGSLTTETDTGNFSETGVGFQPTGGIFASFLNAASGSEVTGLKASLGIASASDERFVHCCTSEDGQATSDCDSAQDDGLLYLNYDYAQGQDGAIDFVSWDADGFTLNQTDADPSANQMIYFVMGSEGGGTTYYETPSGAFTSIGAIVRAMSTSKAGALTPTGAITRTTATAKAGAFTPTGATVRQTATSKAGTFTPSGATVRQTQTSKAGTLTSSGGIVRQAGKAVAGAITSAGSLVRRTGKALAGTLASSGALTTVRTYLRTVVGAFTSSGVLARQTGKALVGTFTGSGAIARTLSRIVSGALTAAGTIRQQINKITAGVLTSGGALIRTGQKTVAGTFTSAGLLVRQSAKVIAGIVTSGGTLARATSTVVVGSFAAVGNLVRQTSKALAGAVTSSGALDTVRTFLRTVAGALVPAGELVRRTGKGIGGSFTSAGTIVRRTAKRLLGVLEPSGALARLLSRLLGLAKVTLSCASVTKLTLSSAAVTKLSLGSTQVTSLTVTARSV